MLGRGAVAIAIEAVVEEDTVMTEASVAITAEETTTILALHFSFTP